MASSVETGDSATVPRAGSTCFFLVPVPCFSDPILWPPNNFVSYLKSFITFVFLLKSKLIPITISFDDSFYLSFFCVFLPLYISLS